MSAQYLEATKRALREYRKGRNVTRLADKHGVARSTLYRAIKLREKKNGR